LSKTDIPNVANCRRIHKYLDMRSGEPTLRTESQSIPRWLWLLALICVVAWFATLGGRKLLNPDEGRYAEIPREMVVTGDWLTPRLDGLKYFEKPPLQYWSTAAAYEVFGVNEFSSRFWCGLTGLLGVALAGLAGAKLFGRSAGVIAAALLGSSLMWVILGHLNTLDMSVSFFLEATLCAFLFAQRSPLKSRQERNWMLIAWAMAALACLTKGLEAIVLPGLAFVAYSLIEREYSAWRRLHVIGGLLLFVVLAAPWFVAMSVVNPEFPHFFFIHEHIERFLTNVHERVEPWWYFIPILIVGVLPWLSLAVRSIHAAWNADKLESMSSGFRPRRFLLLWSATTLLFFSASHSKLAPYILPIIPALALITADVVARLPAATLRRHLVGISALWLVALAYLFLGPLPTKRDTPPELFSTLFHWAQAGAGIAFLGAILGWWLSARGRLRFAVVASCCGAFIGISVLLIGFDAAREIRSGYDLARAIEPHHDARKPFYSVGDYDQSLPFYLGRTLTLVGYRNELDFGLTQEPRLGLADTSAFVRAWLADPAGTVAVMKHEIFAELQERHVPMTVIGRNVDLTAVRKP